MAFIKKRGLKVQIAFTLCVLFAFAMFVQMAVVFMLEVRSTVNEEIAHTRQYLEIIRQSFKIMPTDPASLEILINSFTRGDKSDFSCIEIIGEDEFLQSSKCRLVHDLSQLSRQALEEKSVKITVTGMTWALLFFRNDTIIGAAPLVTSSGELFGTAVVEKSLLPVYLRFEREGKIVLAYFLVNLIVFTAIGFFRMVRILFRPIDKLVQLAEEHRIATDVELPMKNEGSEFWKLTVSLKGMFERIGEDNKKLRYTISELKRVNRELQENKDLIVRSEKLASVGRLSAGLAHEIGNPLSIVQGYVDLLGRTDCDAGEKKVFSEKAGLELGRINALIHQLLDFSKPSDIPEEYVQINSLISELVEFITVEKSFKNCTISLDFNTDNDRVLSERESLKQVILNCLLNSVDAMEGVCGEEKKIAIATKNIKTGQDVEMIQISIKDEGTGIDVAEIDNVFDPFFTTKEAGKGTGLGLFVSYTLLERLGGTIAICNRKEKGVEVVVHLPLRVFTDN